jgi:hypothetical protein
MTDIQKRIAQVEEALAFMGHTHTLQDVLNMIATGELQSFAEGNTWALTHIIDFPQRKVLEIFLVIGDMDEAKILHNVVMAYAAAHGCTLIRTFGRAGWSRQARDHGWTTGMCVFLKEIPDGYGRRTEEHHAGDERNQAPAMG